MEKRVETNVNQKIFSTKLETNYSFIFQNGKLMGIRVEAPEEDILYYLNPEGEQPKVSNDILENALMALLSSNMDGFDILCQCFYGLKKEEEYFNIAVNVYKKYWNKLYNLVIADDVFERGHSFEQLDKTYDFFAES